MRLKDYSRWILQESKESPIFTALNILGILMNISVLVVFLSLALGIETSTIKSITEGVELWKIEVDPLNEYRGSLNELSFLRSDPRVVQLSPVLAEFVEIRTPSKQLIEDEANHAWIDVYAVSHDPKASNGVDLRLNQLNIVYGRNLDSEDIHGIVISEETLQRLVSANPSLSLSNFEQAKIELVTYRIDETQNREYATFPAKIIGVAETTPHSNVQVFVSWELAVMLDTFVNGSDNLSSNYYGREYEQFDIVTYDLDALQSLRNDLQSNGFVTSSILDRIENVQSVMGLIRRAFFVVFSGAIIITSFNLTITLISYVLKRRKEIGILKAIGATDRQIQNIFILHAIYLSVAGGFLGVISAYGVIYLLKIVIKSIDNNLSDIFRVQFSYVLIIVFVAIGISAISSFIPARRAATISPIHSLRE